MLLVPLLSPQGWDYVFLLATPAVVCLLDRLRDVNTAERVFTVAALAMMGLTIYDVVGRTLYFWLISIAIISVGGDWLAGEPGPPQVSRARVTPAHELERLVRVDPRACQRQRRYYTTARFFYRGLAMPAMSGPPRRLTRLEMVFTYDLV